MPQGARTDIASIEAMSQPQAAELFNVSRSNVQRARKVLNEGVPELVKAVEQGQVPVSVAARAERKAGEALAQLERNPRGNPQFGNVAKLEESEYQRVLADTNTPPRTAARWQQVAAKVVNMGVGRPPH
jgi:hypothetical protein